VADTQGAALPGVVDGVGGHAADGAPTAAALWSLEFDKADGLVQPFRRDVRDLWDGILTDVPGWWYYDERKIKKRAVRLWAVRTENELQQAVAAVEAYEFLPCMDGARSSMLERADNMAADLKALKGTMRTEASDLMLPFAMMPDETPNDSWAAQCQNEFMDWDTIRGAMERGD
jgi:hypothetical protein